MKSSLLQEKISFFFFFFSLFFFSIAKKVSRKLASWKIRTENPLILQAYPFVVKFPRLFYVFSLSNTSEAFYLCHFFFLSLFPFVFCNLIGSLIVWKMECRIKFIGWKEYHGVAVWLVWLDRQVHWYAKFAIFLLYCFFHSFLFYLFISA